MNNNYFYTDFHIHSKYSMATSKLLNPEYIDYWSKIKGISVIGTGDAQHPVWFNELKKKLELSDNGLFVLKKKYKINDENIGFFNFKPNYFILSTEISCIYKKNDKVRKIHNIILFDNFDSVKKFQKKLDKIGNIKSDGRPILGLDAKKLLEIVMEISEKNIFIPAHIWTPWFSVLGSKSGFDTIEECFEEYTKYIYAVETGLSSDIPMNLKCDFLDRFILISNSDAHNPENIGRNANIFSGKISFNNILNALKKKNNNFVGTIDMFPQEGKYHCDGHRKCNVMMYPEETIKNNNICPKCGKIMTLGVLYRVFQLGVRNDLKNIIKTKYFKYIISLKTILCKVYNKKGKKSKFINNKYFNLISELGTEFDILFNVDLDKIKNPDLKNFIYRLRNNQIEVFPGYDGEYGLIK